MHITDAQHDVGEILFTEEQIRQRVKELGKEMTEIYKDSNPIMVCILRGASVFFTDLVRAMDCHVTLDFITVSSYGSSTKSSGNINLKKDIGFDIKDRDVVIVDDIMDSGLTLKYLKELLAVRQPRSMKIACMLDKESQHDPSLAPDFCCFSCPDAFVVGYGLDYANYYRNLPYVGILKPEVYAD